MQSQEQHDKIRYCQTMIDTIKKNHQPIFDQKLQQISFYEKKRDWHANEDSYQNYLEEFKIVDAQAREHESKFMCRLLVSVSYLFVLLGYLISLWLLIPPSSLKSALIMYFYISTAVFGFIFFLTILVSNHTDGNIEVCMYEQQSFNEYCLVGIWMVWCFVCPTCVIFLLFWIFCNPNQHKANVLQSFIIKHECIAEELQHHSFV